MTSRAATRPAPNEAEQQLTQADPDLGCVIRAVVARIGRQRITPSRAAPFEAIARAVVYQGVSGKAAAVIFARLKETVGRTFSPAAVLAMSETSLSAAGLSASKSRAILNLADWFRADPNTARTFPDMPDEEIVAALTRIGGIGAWTANVFLIFDLGRPDVMPAGDLGIRRGVQLVCRLKDVATRKQVQERSQLWRPNRSIASIYLWKAIKLRISADDLGTPSLRGGPYSFAS